MRDEVSIWKNFFKWHLFEDNSVFVFEHYNDDDIKNLIRERKELMKNTQRTFNKKHAVDIVGCEGSFNSDGDMCQQICGDGVCSLGG